MNQNRTRKKPYLLPDFELLEWQGFLYPAWLFFTPVTRANFISPAATFDPVKSLEGQPWQTMTTPNQQRQPKTLVIDSHIYLQGMDEMDVLAIAHWLHAQQIPLLFCLAAKGGNQFVGLDEINADNIEDLGYFEPQTDFQHLGQQGYIRDRLATLDYERSAMLFRCLHSINGRMQDDQTTVATYSYHIEAGEQSISPACSEEAADSADSGMLKQIPSIFEQKISKGSNSDLQRILSNFPKVRYQPSAFLDDFQALDPRVLFSKYQSFPELMPIIAPPDFAARGLDRRICDPYYYIVLKDKISADELPTKVIRVTNLNQLKALIIAFPALEARLADLLAMSSRQLLLQCFPEKTHEIYTLAPVQDMAALLDYLQSCPEEADAIISRHLDFIKKQIDLDTNYYANFFNLYRLAQQQKQALHALARPEWFNPDFYKTPYEYIHALSVQPDAWDAFFQSEAVSTYDCNTWAMWISLAPAILDNPYALHHLRTVDPAIFAFDRIRPHFKQLYERLLPAEWTQRIVAQLLEHYPEQSDAIIAIAVQQGIKPSIVKNTPTKIIPKLLQIFREINTNAYPKDADPALYDPRVVRAMEENQRKIGFMPKHYSQFFEHLTLRHAEARARYPQSSLPEMPALSPAVPTETQLLASGCTKLSISHFDQNSLASVPVNLSNLRILHIYKLDPSLGQKTINAFFARIQAQCPELIYLKVPKALMPYCQHLPYRVTCLQEWNIFKAHDVSLYVQFDDFNPNITQADSRPALAPPIDNNLYVDSEGFSSNTRPDGPSKFTMSRCGQLLSPSGGVKHRVRRAVRQFSDDFLQLTIRPPRQLTPIAPPAPLRIPNQANGKHYYEMTLAIKAGQLNRLLSVDSQEVLGVNVPLPEGAQFFRGDDDFYYLTTPVDRQLTYFLEAPAPAISHNWREQQEPAPVLSLIREYLDHPAFKMLSADYVRQLPQESMPDYLGRLFRTREGSCIQRVQALCYAISQRCPQYRDQVRVLDIDGSHTVVEIQAQSRWYQVELGGINAEKSYDNRRSVPASAANPSSSPIQTLSTPQQAAPAKPEIMPQPAPGFVLPAKPRVDAIAQRLLDNRAQARAELDTLLDRVSPLLLVHEQHKSLACAILSLAKAQQRPLFYLEGLASVRVGRDQCHLRDGKPFIDRLDALDLFLQAHPNRQDSLILVDWEAFSNQQRVACNSLLDPEPSLYGKPFHGKVISLVSSLPDDPSFTGRHAEILKPNLGLPARKLVTNYSCVIDLLGYPDWQSALFGPIRLEQNQLVWQPAAFIQALQQGQPILIRHAPDTAAKALPDLLAVAKARGYFLWHHQPIPYPEGLEIAVCRSGFQFHDLPAPWVASEVKLNQLPAQTAIINTVLFDYLLLQKEIRQGQYRSQPGMLAAAAQGELSLYITSSLSTSQWYCLFQEAKRHAVQLRLYLAPGVLLPGSLKVNHGQTQSRAIEAATILVSDNPHLSSQAFPDALVLAIEDYQYSDLVRAIHFAYQQGQFSDFSEAISDLFIRLESGDPVVLYGEWDESLFQALHPLIARFANLTLIIDRKQRINLQFMPTDHCLQASPTMELESSPIRLDEHFAPDIDATSFLANRLALLRQALSLRPVVFMQGPTGIGKTFLMRSLQDHCQDELVVYHGLDAFAAFANDSSKRLKLLFLDEVNILDLNLTSLIPLADGKYKPILFQGQLYTLSDQHRLVCAANPLHYGGRVEQKFFEHPGILQLSLQALPDSYVLEFILYPLYAQVCSTLPEDEFRQLCQTHLHEYKESRRYQTEGICVRHLQEAVLGQLCKLTARPAALGFFPPVKSKPADFVLMPSLLPLVQTMRTAIQIRKQRYLRNRPEILGLNGILIEGSPGLGKSELIRYMLADCGYQPATGAPGLSYLKLEANLPVDLLKAQLRNAFHLGQFVWLDELDTTLDEGLEQCLNALLSGLDPLTHEPAQHPGFMLLVTANGIGMAGRSLISKALRARMTEINMPKPALADLQALIAHYRPDWDASTCQQRAEIYFNTMQTHPSLNLRDISRDLKSELRQAGLEKANSLPVIPAQAGIYALPYP